MKEIYEFDVRGVENKLFCKCRDEDGIKMLVGADGHRIPFDSLQEQIFNPPPKGREQRQNKHRKVS